MMNRPGYVCVRDPLVYCAMRDREVSCQTDCFYCLYYRGIQVMYGYDAHPSLVVVCDWLKEDEDDQA